MASDKWYIDPAKVIVLHISFEEGSAYNIKYQIINIFGTDTGVRSSGKSSLDVLTKTIKDFRLTEFEPTQAMRILYGI